MSTKTHDWPTIQAFYDAPHRTKECLKRFGMRWSTWRNAAATGLLLLDPKRIKKRRNHDFVGRVFGSLTVLSKSPRHPCQFGDKWVCQCSCGVTKTINSFNLDAGHTTSCGCRRKRCGSQHHHWKGIGELSGLSWGRIQSASRIRGRPIPFEITQRQAWDLFLSQARQCKLTGTTLNLDVNRGEITASLDRIDSSKGYVLGNVQWVHKDINLMKWDLTQERFLYWATKIYQHQSKHE